MLGRRAWTGEEDVRSVQVEIFPRQKRFDAGDIRPSIDIAAAADVLRRGPRDDRLCPPNGVPSRRLSEKTVQTLWWVKVSANFGRYT